MTLRRERARFEPREENIRGVHSAPQFTNSMRAKLSERRTARIFAIRKNRA